MFQLVIFNLAGLALEETTTSIDQPVVQHSIYQSLLVQKIAVFLAQWRELGHLVSVSWLFKPGQLVCSDPRQQKAEEELCANRGCSDNYRSPGFLLALSMRLLITLHYEDSQRDKATRKVCLPPEHRLHLRNPCEGWILQRGAAS